MDFLVRRDDLHETKFDDSPAPEIGDGEALLAISRFGLTANNVTYAVMGDAMNYWDFFPAPRTAGAGCRSGASPTSSRRSADGVEEGKRFYGYFPRLEPPGRPAGPASTPTGSSTAPRTAAPLPVRLQPLPLHRTPIRATTRTREDEQMLLRPLFGTSFLLDDELADESCSGAETLVISSASSQDRARRRLPDRAARRAPS